MVPSLILRTSGSKSQPGSGVPAAAFANRSDKVVLNPSAPSATFLQKSGPSAALKVNGSHSSNATTWERLGAFSCVFACATACVAPINIKQPASRPNLIAVLLILVLLHFSSGNCAREITYWSATCVSLRAIVLERGKQRQLSPGRSRPSILAASI